MVGCTTNADCGSGEACLVNSCCDSGFCLAIAPSCAGPEVRIKMMFARGAERRSLVGKGMVDERGVGIDPVVPV
jgi:hypothetical protein